MSEQAVKESQTAGHQLGRYRLLTTLGQGGMGTIHLAVVDGLGDFRKLLVVKELRRDLASNTRFVELFLREAKLAATLSHPNVVQTLEASQIDDHYFLVMEFLDGQPLSMVLTRAARADVPLPLMLHVLCEVLAGLHYAHNLRDYTGRAEPVIHRDVCPQNIFVTYDGQVKVVDFGIAKAIDSESEGPNLFKGKMGYAAPEQILGEPLGCGVDVFAAGVVLWEMITLRRFARGAATPEAIAARIAGREPRVSWLLPEVDPELAVICDRALAVDPTERYATADEMRIALTDYLASRGRLVDRAVLASMMQQEFAAERVAMQEVVHAGLRSRSGMAPAGSASRDPSAGLDDVTAVADLSEFVEVSRANVEPGAIEAVVRKRQAGADPVAALESDEHGSATPGDPAAPVAGGAAYGIGLRRMWRRRVALGAVFATGAMVAGYALFGSHDDGVTATALEPNAPAGPSRSDPSPSPQTRTRPAAPPTPTRPLLSGAPGPSRAARAGADTSAASSVGTPGDGKRDDRAGEQRAPRARVKRDHPRHTARRERRASKSRHSPKRAHPRAPEPEASRASAPERDPSVSGEAPAAGSARPVEMGMDLKPAPQRPTGVAFENPFE